MSNDQNKVIENKLIDNRNQEDKHADIALDEIIEQEKGLLKNLRVIAASPLVTYFDDQALSVSAVNLIGPFDILPEHHNFICLLVPCTVAIRTTNKQINEISINGGLLHVKNNNVQIFLDI
jgi:hypothetical protein